MKASTIDAQNRPAILSRLQHVPLFQPLTEAQHIEILKHANLIEISMGEIIVKEGERTQEFYVLLVGEANLVVSLPDGSEYQDVGHLSAGAIIGELAALLNEPRTATLVAAKTCQLLRFEHDHFLRLFEEVPAFGLAVSRMLAERMRDTFFDKLSLFSEIMPRSITLPASDLSRMRSYMAKYYATAIKNVLRKHQLIVQRTLPRYQTQFSLSDEEQAHWFRLFNVTDRERVTPFTYYTMSGTMILMKIVEGVGVNFKNLLHLKSVMRFNAAGRILEAGKPYLVSIELHDIVQLREDRVALVTVTSMYDQDKVLIQTFKDFFIILNLEPEYFNILRANKGFGRHDASEFMGLSERAPHLASADRVNQVVIDVPHDMGLQYGKVSGDLNMVHTTAFAAKLFGYPRPFIQGLCTANYVLKYLTGSTARPIQEFDITFARPVFVGEPFHLYFTDTSFEVCRADDKLAAYGEWQ